MASAKPAILAALARRGWVCHASARAEAVLDEIRVLGDLLGARAVGRAGLVEEIIKPHARDAVKVLIVANEFLEAQVRELQAAVSHGYARGKFEPAPRDRKDWYD